MRLTDQNIPSELLDAYKRSLRQAAEWHPGSGIHTIRTRQPFRLPHMQSSSLHSPTAAQLAVRDAFKKCVDCFNGMPLTGGAVPPELGYRSRQWWYNLSQGSGMYYFNYFMSLTWWFFYDNTIPEWCGLCIPLDHIGTAYKKEHETDLIYGFDASWDEAWSLYQGTSWTEIPYEWDVVWGFGSAYKLYSKYKCNIRCDKLPLVFKPCEHVSESKWLQVETIKLVYYARWHYSPVQGGHMRFVNSGEIRAQDSGNIAWYIHPDYWNYDEMVLTFETFAQDKPDMKPFRPVVDYTTNTRGCQNDMYGVKLYCVGKGLY